MEKFLSLSDRLTAPLKGPKLDLFRNVAPRIYREVYGEGIFDTHMEPQFVQELTLLVSAIRGLSELTAKKTETKVVLDVMAEFRGMISEIDPVWPQDWLNSVHLHLGNVITYAIRRRSNFDSPPTPNLKLIA